MLQNLHSWEELVDELTHQAFKRHVCVFFALYRDESRQQWRNLDSGEVIHLVRRILQHYGQV